MKHLIIGRGSLASALRFKLQQLEIEVIEYHRGNGFNYPIQTMSIPEDVEVIWNTVGGGSIPEGDKDFELMNHTHLGLLLHLYQHKHAHQMLISFSSDYAAQPQKSKYAFTKYLMEQFVDTLRPDNVLLFRVSNLYDQFKGLPTKLHCNRDKIQVLPANLIAPTPTEWLAYHLANFDLKELEMIARKGTKLLSGKNRVYHLAPEESMTVRDFGELVLNKEIRLGDYDNLRPSLELSNDFDLKETVEKCYMKSSFKSILDTSIIQ